ncbi:MAG: hypothetical protein QG622_1986 [Actinomycetota bacterium]|nr:hypothetical protein [Actinomycetota bacterium]
MRTAMGYQNELEFEGEFEGEVELEFEGEFEDEFEGEFEDEFEGEFEGEFEDEGEFESSQKVLARDMLNSVLGSSAKGPISPAQEMELAGELLELESEAELEQFVGRLFRRVGRGVAGFARSEAGRALGGVLKNVAKQALPTLGGALGSAIPGLGGIGGMIGSKLGQMASNALEMEGEVVQHELEFEVARRVVRIAADATRRASRTPSRSATPKQIVRNSIIAATRRHAPAALIELSPRAAAAVRARGARASYVSPRFRGRRPAATAQWPATRPRRRRYYRQMPMTGYTTSPDRGSGMMLGRGGRWERRGNTIVMFDA